MKQFILPILLLVFGSYACTSTSEEDEITIPQKLKAEVEEFINTEEAAFGHEFETYEGIDWKYAPIESPDSIIYPFAVLYQRDGKLYPFKHRVISKADTLSSIQKFNYIFDAWISITPKPYDVRKETWWTEITASEHILSFTYGKKKLELIDSTSNNWREVFFSNVVVVFKKADTLWADSLFWYPHSKKIVVPQFRLKTMKNDSLESVFIGLGFESDVDFTNWSIQTVKGTMQYD